MTNPIKLPQEIIDEIQDKYLILIIGDQRCGKTSESCEIAKHLNKPSFVIVEEAQHKPDEILHDEYGIKRIIAGEEFIRPIIKKLTNSTLIYDDFESANPRQKNNIKDISIHTAKRKLTLILNYHGRSVPSKYLYMENSFLIVKHNANLPYSKIKNYFKNIKGVSLSAYDYCSKNIKMYDAVYILKNGTYYHRDGQTNKITTGIFRSKSRKRIHINKLKRLALEGNTQKDIAKELEVSSSRIYKEISALKQKDPEFKKAYENLKKKKTVATKGKIGKRLKSDILIRETHEKLYSLENKNMRDIAQISEWNLKEEIGNFASEVLFKGIVEGFREAKKKNLIKSAILTISTSRDGADIGIEVKDKMIEIEVKNYKPTTNKKNMGKVTIEKQVIPRFSNVSTEKWLFTCGQGVNRLGRDLLDKNDINYDRITYKQIKKGQKDRIYNTKQKMRSYVDSWIT